MALFTVLGAAGFIGSRVVQVIRRRGHECRTPSRHQAVLEGSLGHVIYCIGLTADFRTRPFETVDAHVTRLSTLVRAGGYDSLLYLSSCRVYKRVVGTAREESVLPVDPADPDDYYNLSKAMGEAIVLSGPELGRVVRLSNVYGADRASENFLTTIVREALRDGRVHLRTSLRSEKDYVNVDAVAGVLPEIALNGAGRVYNVASGSNTSTADLIDRLQNLMPIAVDVAADAVTIAFPRIDVERVRSEFRFPASDVVADLPAVVDLLRS